MDKLSPSIRVSGGTPAGMPDYKPMGPAELRKLLSRPARPPLFQVWVDAAGRGTIPVGPRVPMGVADSLAAAIRRQILLGREKLWNNPCVVAVEGLGHG